MTDIFELGYRVDTRGLARGEAATKRFTRQVDTASMRMTHMGVAGNQAFRSMAMSARSALLPVAGLVGSLAGVRAIGQASEQYDNLRNKFIAMGESAEQAAGTLERVASIANQTRSPLGATAELYTLLSFAADDLGASTQELEGFTSTVGMALSSFGVSGNEASGALLQLSQAMAGGVVRAEEFNSILEGAFPIAKAAADGIEAAAGSVGKLREMVVEGEVSSREFFEAVLSQQGQVKEAFESTALTVGQSMNKLRTSLTLALGGAEGTSSAMGALARTISAVADNVGPMAEITGRVLSNLQDRVQQFGEAIGGWGPVLQSAKSAFDALGSALSAWVGGVAAYFEGFARGLTQFRGWASTLESVRSGWQNLVAALEPVSSMLSRIFGSSEASASAFERLSYVFGQIVGSTVGAVIGGIAQTLELVMNVISRVTAAWTGFIGLFKDGIQVSDISSLWRGIADFYRGIVSDISGYFAGMFGNISSAFGLVGDLFIEVAGRMGLRVVALSESVKATFSSIYGVVTEVAANMLTKIGNFINKSIGLFHGFGRATAAAFGLIPNGVRAALQNAVDSITRVVARVINWVADKINSFIKAVQPAFRQLSKVPGINVELNEIAPVEISAPNIFAGVGDVEIPDLNAILRDSVSNANYVGDLGSGLRDVAGDARAAAQEHRAMADRLIELSGRPLESLNAIGQAINSLGQRPESPRNIHDEMTVRPSNRRASPILPNINGGSGGGGSGGGGGATQRLSDEGRQLNRVLDTLTPASDKLAQELRLVEGALEAGTIDGRKLSEVEIDRLTNHAENLRREIAGVSEGANGLTDAFKKMLIGFGSGDSKGAVKGFWDSLKQQGLDAFREMREDIFGINGVFTGGLSQFFSNFNKMMGQSVKGLRQSLSDFGSLIGTGKTGGGLGGLAGIGSIIKSAMPAIGMISAGVGLFNKAKALWGHLTRTELRGQGLQGSIGGGGASVFSVQRFKKNNPFGRDKWFSRSQRQGEASQALAEQAAAMQDAVTQMAGTLRLEASGLDGIIHRFSVGDGGQLKAQVEIYGNLLASSLDGLSSYVRAGESSLDALGRLSGAMAGVNATFEALGFQLYEVGLAGANAASGFADLFGGLEQFTTATGAYYDRFYTDAEKLEFATRGLSQQLSELGINVVPMSTKAFRSLVDDAMAAGNEQLAASLMQLSPSMAQVLDQTESLNESLDQTADRFQTVNDARLARAMRDNGLTSAEVQTSDSERLERLMERLIALTEEANETREEQADVAERQLVEGRAA